MKKTLYQLTAAFFAIVVSFAAVLALIHRKYRTVIPMMTHRAKEIQEIHQAAHPMTVHSSVNPQETVHQRAVPMRLNRTQAVRNPAHRHQAIVP